MSSSDNYSSFAYPHRYYTFLSESIQEVKRTDSVGIFPAYFSGGIVAIVFNIGHTVDGLLTSSTIQFEPALSTPGHRPLQHELTAGFQDFLPFFFATLSVFSSTAVT